jgi:hypothetical protein
MVRRSAVLLEFAKLFAQSAAGRHGKGSVDFQPDYEEVLQLAGCAEGEAREQAERELRGAADANIIRLEYDRERARTTVLKIRFAPDMEQVLFDYLGLSSPSQIRQHWVALFNEAASWAVPAQYSDAWLRFCERRAGQASEWRHMSPFRRHSIDDGRHLLLLLVRLLCWEGTHLVRWVSSLLCGDSKLLERRQSTLQRLLSETTEGKISRFAQLGILPVPPDVTFHGPIRLRINHSWRDFCGLAGPTTLSAADAEKITGLECEAVRCLTVENATPFRSLVSLASGELLIHTSYPNEATLMLLRRLAEYKPALEFWHFGDIDPSGFHILWDLRKRSGLPFRALQMKLRPLRGKRPLADQERELLSSLLSEMAGERAVLEGILDVGDCGDYEQESLGPPPFNRWPFY